MKSVGINAISYVGTTFLSMVLGGHPRVLNVGHCYLFFPPWRSVHVHQWDKPTPCFVCESKKVECRLTKLKDLGIHFTPGDAYEAMSHVILRESEDVIVDSSSTLSWFCKSKPDILLTVFRDPIGLGSSYLKHLRSDVRFKTDKEILDYMCNAYIRIYGSAVSPCVEYKDMVNVTTHLADLFKYIGLDFGIPYDYMNYWQNDVHAIGGNKSFLIPIVFHKYGEKERDRVAKEMAHGNKDYYNYYRYYSAGNFKGNINILTEEQSEYVMEKCGTVYKKLVGDKL